MDIQPKKDLLLSSLSKTFGNVSQACDDAGIARSEFYRYLREDEDFAAAVDAIREESIDFAENSLMKQIQEGNTVATIFFLKCHGKKRGYVDKPIPQDIKLPLDKYKPE